jgi:hypothetical protein
LEIKCLLKARRVYLVEGYGGESYHTGRANPHSLIAKHTSCQVELHINFLKEEEHKITTCNFSRLNQAVQSAINDCKLQVSNPG